MADRYQVIKGSESGHCCFEYTVVVTLTNAPDEYESVCECFEKEHAEKIAYALNRK